MNLMTCGTPGCEEDAIEGRRFCSPCAGNLDRIRQELTDDPMLLYNQRSDTRQSMDDGTGVRKKRTKSAPRCCKPGCFEHREPGTPFCFAHEDEVEDDDG